MELRAAVGRADRHLVELRAWAVDHLAVHGGRPRIGLERVNGCVRECAHQRQGVMAVVRADLEDGRRVDADQLLQDGAVDINVSDGRDVACHGGRVSFNCLCARH